MKIQIMAVLAIGSVAAQPGGFGPGGGGFPGMAERQIVKDHDKDGDGRLNAAERTTALEALTKEGITITVYSDSQYVVKAVEQGWLKNWVATDFKGGKKNKDLWLRYHALSKKNQIKFVWVKGHASNAFNNRCDVLATAAADGHHLAADEMYEAEN